VSDPSDPRLPDCILHFNDGASTGFWLGLFVWGPLFGLIGFFAALFLSL
jgi:hypothetical protein